MRDEQFEIYPTFVASTGHVTEEDISKLLNLFDGFGKIFYAYETETGIKLYLASEDMLDLISSNDLSDGLRLLVLFAISNNCRYLELHNGVSTYKNFPVYQWA